jgi:metallopeptidase MepB
MFCEFSNPGFLCHYILREIHSGRLFALDIFKTGFEKDTLSMDNGRKYRKMVLRVGGSQPEMKTLTDYLGHPPSTRPYFEYLGIATGDDEHSLV